MIAAWRTARVHRFDDLQGAGYHSPWKAMGNPSSRADVALLKTTNAEWCAGWNLTQQAAHPGFASKGLFASGPGGLLSLASDSMLVFVCTIGNRRADDRVAATRPKQSRALLWNRRIARAPARP